MEKQMLAELPIWLRYVLVVFLFPVFLVQSVRLAFSTRGAEESITDALWTSALGMYLNATMYANGTFDHLKLTLESPDLEV